MPRATVDTTPVHEDLKSLPEGFVELKRMPYGNWLKRQEMSMRMTVEAAEGNKKGMRGEMELSNHAVTSFEFSNCIVDHNLEDAAGVKLDFTQPQAIAVLDPQVGNEISELIREMHEVDEGNSGPSYTS